MIPIHGDVTLHISVIPQNLFAMLDENLGVPHNATPPPLLGPLRDNDGYWGGTIR